MKHEVSWDEVARFRLQRHHLMERAPRDKMEKVVSDVCGVQAQVRSATRLALWTRIKNLRPGDVDRALWESRTLVKTWCMRDTLHLLAAEEYPLYLEGVMRSRLARGERWFSKRGSEWPPDLQPLLPEELRTVSALIGEIVSEGPLTRREIVEQVGPEVAPKLRPWLEDGWGALVKYPCYEGRLHHGPDRGQNVTFVRPDLWLAKLPSTSRGEAEETILLRYLHAYGPATPQDFAHWAGTPLSSAKAIWQRLDDLILPVSIEGSETFILGDDVDSLRGGMADEGRSMRLLPSYDVYLLGHKDKGHLIDQEHYKLVFRGLARISPVVLFDGRVLGIWSSKRATNKVTIAVKPFKYLSRELRDQLHEQAGALEDFFDLPCELVTGEPAD